MTKVEEPAGEPQDGDGRAKGGLARAKSLTAEERSAIARKAARARWSENVAEVVCGSADSPLRIGGIEIGCYVLEDDTRVLTQADFLQALGRHRKANSRAEELPPILQGKAINRFITPEIVEKSKPISFRLPSGVRAYGYNAELLPDVCEIYLLARDAGELPRNQQHVAVQADILMRGLARVGIIALVDEATGYQHLRAKNALAKILEEFVDKELQPWISTFPDDFYREMFRLRELNYLEDSVKRPMYFGHLTNDVVYKRLAPGVLEELKRVVPKTESGRRKHKFHQRLTTNVGYPKLREHLGSVVTLMKLSTDWHDFTEKLDRIHPKVGDTLKLPFQGGTDNGVGL